MGQQYTTGKLVDAWVEGLRGIFTRGNNFLRISLEDEGIFIAGTQEYYAISELCKTAIWTKVQQPVSDKKAFAAYKAGKVIRCVTKGFRNSYRKANSDNSNPFITMPVDDLLCGEWYIEED